MKAKLNNFDPSLTTQNTEKKYWAEWTLHSTLLFMVFFLGNQYYGLENI